MPDNKKAAQENTCSASNTHTNFYTPKIGTQPDRLLTVLQSGRTITPLEVCTALLIMRVADTAFKLHGMGCKVETIDTDVINQFGEPTSYASYQREGAMQ